MTTTTNLAGRPPKAPRAVTTEHRPLRDSVEEVVEGYFDALRLSGLTRHHRVSFCRTALGGQLEL